MVGIEPSLYIKSIISVSWNNLVFKKLPQQQNFLNVPD
jgi:hypothetical protein